MDNKHIEHLHGKELERLFNDATKYFESIAPKLPADILLKFYARYKQAKEGPCNIEKPGFFNFQAKGEVFFQIETLCSNQLFLMLEGTSDWLIQLQFLTYQKSAMIV